MGRVTGGGLIAEMLAAEGVDTVFGIVDGSYLGLCAGLRDRGIRIITPRHETCAAHMAGAYARLTGKLGVCIASNGPGVANVLPGVAVENGEGNRVLLITSCRRQGIVYPDRGGSYQYFNQVAVTRPMTKWSATVPAFERIGEIMHRAFRISFRGRPGVVHVDVPENVMNGTFKYEQALLEPRQYRRLHPIAPPADQVQAAAELLKNAQRPLIHAGSGVIHAQAHEELLAVAERLQAPVTTSWGGRAALPETHPLSVSMIYVDLNNSARSAADVVLVLGSRLGETDWWGRAPYWGNGGQKVIQVDVDDDVLGLNKPASMTVLSDVGLFLAALAEQLKGTEPTAERRAYAAGLAEQKRIARGQLDKALQNTEAPMHPAHVAHICREVFDDDAVLVADGGNTTIWANFFHEVRSPNTQLSTFKFGMLGAGVAQALGAKAALPDRQVYCIIGDGAMGFHPQEIETAVRNELPVIYLVLCDRQWGMVKMTQQFAFKPLKTLIKKSLDPDETINADLGEIAFDKLAESMGAHGERVQRPDELEPAIRRCLAAGTCAVIHIDVDPVQHMWAPNLRDFKDMHQEPKG